MLTRFASVALAAIAGTSVAIASPFGDAANRLDGRWEGDGLVLKVDSIRAQASLDPSRPFEWQRFVVKEVTEDELVFAVGNELFQATVDADALRLTGTSFRGEKVLRRAADGAQPLLETRGALP